jgi:hypothetical protein
MGSGASTLNRDRVRLFVPKYRLHYRLKYRFDLAKEATLSDCFLARTSWYRINAQATFYLGEGDESCLVSLSPAQNLSCPFFRRLYATYPLHSTLLQRGCSFKNRCVDLLSLLSNAIITLLILLSHY